MRKYNVVNKKVEELILLIKNVNLRKNTLGLGSQTNVNSSYILHFIINCMHDY